MPHLLEEAEADLLSFLLVVVAAEGMGLWAVAVEAGHLWAVAAEVGRPSEVAVDVGPWPVVVVAAAATRRLVLEVAVEATRQRQQPWVAQVAGLLSQAAAADPARRQAQAAESGGARS